MGKHLATSYQIVCDGVANDNVPCRVKFVTEGITEKELPMYLLSHGWEPMMDPADREGRLVAVLCPYCAVDMTQRMKNELYQKIKAEQDAPGFVPKKQSLFSDPGGMLSDSPRRKAWIDKITGGKGLPDVGP